MEATTTPNIADVLTAWQTDHEAVRDAMTDLVGSEGVAAGELFRGMVAEQSAADLVAAFTGTCWFPATSFTADEEVADSFAQLDDDVEDGETRVKFFLAPGATGLEVQGNEDFDFEVEVVVAGDFICEAQFLADENLVVVTATTV